jgi:hypothetical protein
MSGKRVPESVIFATISHQCLQVTVVGTLGSAASPVRATLRVVFRLDGDQPGPFPHWGPELALHCWYNLQYFSPSMTMIGRQGEERSDLPFKASAVHPRLLELSRFPAIAGNLEFVTGQQHGWMDGESGVCLMSA